MLLLFCDNLDSPDLPPAAGAFLKQKAPKNLIRERDQAEKEADRIVGDISTLLFVLSLIAGFIIMIGWSGLYQNMHSRCCTESMKKDKPWYEGVTMCEEWLKDKKKFSKWVQDHYYVLPDGEFVQLDKDTLYPGNNEYSPDKCIFLPMTLNLFCRNYPTRKNGLPTGVYANNKRTKFKAVITMKHKKYRSDWFDSVEEALIEYWDYYELYFEEYLYLKYKDIVPEENLEAVRNWIHVMRELKLLEWRDVCRMKNEMWFSDFADEIKACYSKDEKRTIMCRIAGFEKLFDNDLMINDKEGYSNEYNNREIYG